MDVKKELQRIHDLKISYKNELDYIKDLRRIYKRSAYTFEDLPITFQAENIIRKIENNHRKALRRITLLLMALEKMEEILEDIEDPVEKRLLFLRYVKCMKWEDVAADMHYSLRGVFEVHKRALESVSERFK